MNVMHKCGRCSTVDVPPYLNPRCCAIGAHRCKQQLDSEMSGALQTLLMNLVNGERDECPEADPDAADAQADELHESRGNSPGGGLASFHFRA